MKILLIEDQVDLQKAIRVYLESEGYVVEVASDFRSGDDKAITYVYDCVLVDISLPDGNGIEIIKQLKINKSKAGIIIISAHNSLEDKIRGLELGADDYLPKPFHLSEMIARVKALIRRNNFNGDLEIVINEIIIIPEERRVLVNNQQVNLTAKEYDILLYFVSNKNHVVSKSALVEHIWGDSSDNMNGVNFLYNHIKNLRKKLLEKGSRDYITSIYGLGYNFNTSK